MADYSYQRRISFESILNFRDLGGYRAGDGNMVAWRRIFRSGELHNMSVNDIARLKEEIGIASVIDLRNSATVAQLGTGPLDELGVKYYGVPLVVISGGDVSFHDFSDSGELYLYRMRTEEYGRSIVEVLEIIADTRNCPAVFHCNAGKDRSGILAAMVLGVLGVTDEDIIADYAMSADYIDAFVDRWNNDPRTADVHKNIPEYQIKVYPESMRLFLSGLKDEYGSIRGYIEANGAEASLIHRLEEVLLV
jgi:protein-tyrosine phosphatase